MDARFLNSNDISPFDVVYYKSDIDPLILRTASYYEWNAKDQKWFKLSENTPEPPIDLSPGRFDGQIVEVPRNAI